MATVWQVAGGPANRRYADVLLRHGVALIGPGDTGPWDPRRDDEDFEGSYVRRFATEAQIADPIVLRIGTSRIAAVGILAGGYEHLSQFEDTNGWDLSHARRVRWRELPSGEYDFGSAVFGGMPTRFSAVANTSVIDYVERFLKSPPTHWQTAPLPDLPAGQPPLGIVPEAFAGLVAQAADLLPLMQGSQRFGELPSEDELIVHFVVPFLRALGWPPEWIAVKWRSIDVAVFRALPRTPATCRFVIEAKRLGAGIEGALEQAQSYVTTLGVSCDVIVTDGIRYRMYDGARSFEPLAYANLARLKRPAADLFARLKRP